MNQLLTAIKFSMKEQLSNRFALGLLIIFVPIWYWMLGVITPGSSVPFRLSNNSYIQINGHNLILLTAGLNVLALILGFMFFHSSHKSLTFDKRLARAGLNQAKFILAKTIALTITTALLSLYTLLVLLIFWHSPNNIFVLWLGFWFVSLIYGSFGLFLGMLLSSELAGFFIVIMLSQMDVFLQIPIANPAANKSLLKFLPSYGAVQLSTMAGFTHNLVGGELLFGGVWFITFTVVAFVIFYIRTKRKQ